MSAAKSSLRPERILELSTRLNAAAGEKIVEITSVNRTAKMLSMNAMIVAARAGEAGKSFAVVADEFKTLSDRIDWVTAALDTQMRTDLAELDTIGVEILKHMRGQRLVDLALNAIEIIDRNLYERTCDVRWWATDAAVVECVTSPSKAAAQHACGRLKVILDAYTVYLDLWICDAAGRVVASGRPDRYPGVRGLSVAGSPWFARAMRLNSGDDFVTSDVERQVPLGDVPVATYATAIRQGGEARGKAIGVLGIHFDWRPQAQCVVDGVRLTESERRRSRVMILDQNQRILASSDGVGSLEETFSLRADATMGSYADGAVTVGYALTPGYETYKGMGWYGCIAQHPESATA